MEEFGFFTVNAEVLKAAIKQKGFGSIEELASTIGVHRNAIGNYLQGARAIPEVLGKVLDTLEISPAQVFEGTRPRRHIPGLEISKLIDSITACHANAAICLFGSRSRGDNKKNSDIDLGIYRSKKISFKEFSPLMTMVDDFNEDLSTPVQLVNLTSADKDFLLSIREDLMFLGGSLNSWAELLRKADVVLI
ncbi:MAG: nucleotidyltransferase domain-containing protein [Bdellovibrionota bacterium]